MKGPPPKYPVDSHGNKICSICLKKKTVDAFPRARKNGIRGECCGGLGGRYGVVWDHNHGTGKFRGWLCDRCNRVLGLCGDNPVTLKLLAMYLEVHGYAST